uniref:SP-RING-type domain-containing protein n=1 Tax=Ascaris lumbricoides TaxID=6252 RepID=A0A0M3II35_ASCLU
MRFFLLDDTREQPDDFPPNCKVRIDNREVALPNVIPTKDPNVEAKRPSCPVDITPFVQQPSRLDNVHSVHIQWAADMRAWAVGIFVVKRVTSEILMKRLLANVRARRDMIVTKMAIRTQLTDRGDSSLHLERVEFMLLCPLGKTRIVTPVKGSECSHLKCFDLMFFLKMNEKRPTWKCPICDKAVPYNKIIIDGYFEEVLEKAGRNITKVELLPNGDWRAIVDQRRPLFDCGEVPAKKRCSILLNNRLPQAAAAASRAATAPTHVADDGVIVLASGGRDFDESTQQHSLRQALAPNIESVAIQR